MGAWKTAFAAVAALLGEPVESIRAALGPCANAGSPGDEAVEALLRVLEQGSREARARAMSIPLALVASDIEAARMV